jgi:hypothetical protein
VTSLYVRVASRMGAGHVDIRPPAVQGLRIVAEAAGYPHWDVEKVAATPCCWMRFLLADLCISVRLSAKPNLNNFSDKKLHANQTDREIVIFATYADEFLSFDEGAVWLEKALRTCIRELFPAGLLP